LFSTGETRSYTLRISPQISDAMRAAAQASNQRMSDWVVALILRELKLDMEQADNGTRFDIKQQRRRLPPSGDL